MRSEGGRVLKTSVSDKRVSLLRGAGDALWGRVCLACRTGTAPRSIRRWSQKPEPQSPTHRAAEA
jgi:hypothetical protein